MARISLRDEDNKLNIVVLGGINSKTGKENPLSVEGYYVRKDKFQTKFGLKDVYTLANKDGEISVLGGTNLHQQFQHQKCKLGRYTWITDLQETKPMDKGNPMKLYRVEQNPEDCIDPALYDLHGFDQAKYSSGSSSEDANGDDWQDQLDDVSDEVIPPPPVAPRAPATAPSAERQAKVQALLKGSRAKAS
jgi:hypothetical protein